MNLEYKIGVIIVLYQSNYSIDKLSDNFLYFIIDNTPNRDLGYSSEKCIYVPLFNNRGIAYAQNVGIREAIKCGCSHVVFFDQDSRMDSSYITLLFNEYLVQKSLHPDLFLLGPSVVDMKTNKEYKSIIHKDVISESNFVERREIISSGSIVSIRDIQNVGFLDEYLFIDYVDFEWCWRANKKGYISGITKNLNLLHMVGEKTIHFFNYQIIVSSPFRYYYQYRNFFILLRRSYVPLQWKINIGIKKFLALFYTLFMKDGLKMENYMWKGIFEGLKSK